MPRLLVVHPELGVQAALAVILEGDLRLVTTSTASEGLRYAAKQPPDLAVLGFSLPDLDVATLVSGLRARVPGCPVLVIDVIKGENSLIRALLALRIDGLLWKPLDLHALLRDVNALLAPEGSRSLRRQPSRQPRPQVSKAIEFLASQYGRHSLTGELIAKSVGISGSHLAHLFAAETGLTVGKFLTKLRVEVAKRLLMTGSEKLESIAELSGFCDASHLSRVFHRCAGCPPGKYRRDANGEG